MKKITLNSLNSKFISTAVIDRTRDIKSSMQSEQTKLNKEFRTPLSPATLYAYYVSVCLVKSFDLTDDKKVATVLGYPLRSVADARRKLTKGNWILFESHIYQGKKYGQWYIGTDVVAKYQSGTGITLKEQVKLGLITEQEALAVEPDDIYQIPTNQEGGLA